MIVVLVQVHVAARNARRLLVQQRLRRRAVGQFKLHRAWTSAEIDDWIECFAFVEQWDPVLQLRLTRPTARTAISITPSPQDTRTLVIIISVNQVVLVFHVTAQNRDARG